MPYKNPTFTPAANLVTGTPMLADTSGGTMGVNNKIAPIETFVNAVKNYAFSSKTTSFTIPQNQDVYIEYNLSASGQTLTLPNPSGQLQSIIVTRIDNNPSLKLNITSHNSSAIITNPFSRSNVVSITMDLPGEIFEFIPNPAGNAWVVRAYTPPLVMHAYRNTDISVATNGVVPFNTILSDSYGVFNNSTFRFTSPTNGVYSVSGALSVNWTGTPSFEISGGVSGAGYLFSRRSLLPNVASNIESTTFAANAVAMTLNQQFWIVYQFGGGGGYFIRGAGGVGITYLQITLVGRTA